MATKTKAMLAFAALVVAGFASPAGAETVFPSDQASYARWRVDAAFDVVARLPIVAAVSVPMATKGDLPVPAGCAALSDDAQAECMDVAYEPDAPSSVVVETRIGSTSTLMRMDAMTIAGFTTEQFEQTE
jgi:hypothetical protein